jgi:hypothetical protein
VIKKHWTMLCCFAFALVVLLGTSLALPATPPPVVPLVPSPVLVKAWAHVRAYSGTYSGDRKQSSSAALSEHFQGSTVLTRMPNPDPNSAIISFYGSAGTLTTGSGTCGTGSTSRTSLIVLTVNLLSHTYILTASPDPGALQISGGPAGCPKPYYNTVHVGTFFVRDALLPAPAAGICGTKSAQISLLAGGTENDKYSWRLVPATNDHEKITMHCATVE